MSSPAPAVKRLRAVSFCGHVFGKARMLPVFDSRKRRKPAVAGRSILRRRRGKPASGTAVGKNGRKVRKMQQSAADGLRTFRPRLSTSHGRWRWCPRRVGLPAEAPGRRAVFVSDFFAWCGIHDAAGQSSAVVAGGDPLCGSNRPCLFRFCRYGASG